MSERDARGRGRRNQPHPNARETSCLLYVDVLGVKARWTHGGAPAVLEAYDALNTFVQAGLSALSEQTRSEVRGGTQSDAAALIFRDARDAVLVGRVMFQAAFSLGESRDDQRYWLRGAIVPCRPDEPLWTPDDLVEGSKLTSVRPSDALLHAISVEQGGLKGMRLVIDKHVASWGVRTYFAVWLRADLPIRTIRAVTFLELPEHFLDVLWMVPDNLVHWPRLQRRAADRVRWSALNAEELTHAAMTLVGFESCGALMHSIQSAHFIDGDPMGGRMMSGSESRRIARALGRFEPEFDSIELRVADILADD